MQRVSRIATDVSADPVKDRPCSRITDDSGISLEPTRLDAGFSGHETFPPSIDLIIRQLGFKLMVGYIDVYDVTVSEQTDQTAFRRLGGDVADTSAACATRETSVSYERDTVTQALTDDV